MGCYITWGFSKTHSIYQQQVRIYYFSGQHNSWLLKKIFSTAVSTVFSRCYLMILSVSALFNQHVLIDMSMLLLVCRTLKCFVSDIKTY